MNKYLKQLSDLRARNNKHWMSLVALGLECDQIKYEFRQVMNQILRTDIKIQQVMRRMNETSRSKSTKGKR